MVHILVKGDCLYKLLRTLGMLSADQLPGLGKMISHNISFRYARLETQLATLTFGDSFLRDVLRKMQIMLALLCLCYSWKVLQLREFHQENGSIYSIHIVVMKKS